MNTNFAVFAPSAPMESDGEESDSYVESETDSASEIVRFLELEEANINLEPVISDNQCSPDQVGSWSMKTLYLNSPYQVFYNTGEFLLVQYTQPKYWSTRFPNCNDV